MIKKIKYLDEDKQLREMEIDDSFLPKGRCMPKFNESDKKKNIKHRGIFISFEEIIKQFFTDKGELKDEG